MSTWQLQFQPSENSLKQPRWTSKIFSEKLNLMSLDQWDFKGMTDIEMDKPLFVCRINLADQIMFCLFFRNKLCRNCRNWVLQSLILIIYVQQFSLGLIKFRTKFLWIKYFWQFSFLSKQSCSIIEVYTSVRTSRLAIFVNLCILELSFRLQTLYYESCNS